MVLTQDIICNRRPCDHSQALPIQIKLNYCISPGQPVKCMTNEDRGIIGIATKLIGSLCRNEIAPHASLRGVNTHGGPINVSVHVHQDHLEEAGVAAAVNVALAAGGTEHCPVEKDRLELRRNGHAALLAADGVAHDDLRPRPVLDEDEAVAAIEHVVIVGAAAASKGETRGRDAVRRVKDGGEDDPGAAFVE